MWFKNRRAKWRKQRLEAAAAGARSSGTDQLTDIEWTDEANWGEEEECSPMTSSPVRPISVKRIGVSERKTADGHCLVLATDSEPCSEDSEEEEAQVEETTSKHHDGCQNFEDNQRHTELTDNAPRLPLLPPLPPQLYTYGER